jgi:hypothetical protein
MPTYTEDYRTDISIETGDDEQFREGRVARAIEHQTAKIPSDVFLWAAAGSALLSLAAQLGGVRSEHRSLFIGQWVPTLLILGLYNKLVKIEGSDRQEKRERESAGY